MTELLNLFLLILLPIIIGIVLPQLHLAGNVYEYGNTRVYWARGHQIGHMWHWTCVKPTWIPYVYFTDHEMKPMRLDPADFHHVLNR